MIYDVRLPEWDNRPREVYDANGVKVHKVIRCDTETGEIVKFKTNDIGAYVWNDGHDDIVTESLLVPSPLKVVLLEASDALP